LVVDEAQALSDELLEEIRLLANMETPTNKLLPVVLAGQPELAGRLNEPRHRQLKQRIALRCELKRLDLPETAAYIASRIRTAGANPAKLFTREAVTLIYEYSRGVPRTISVMCDNALMSGFAADRTPIDGEMVREVCRDFDLGLHEGADPESVARTADEPSPTIGVMNRGTDRLVPLGPVSGPQGRNPNEPGTTSIFALRALPTRGAPIDPATAQNSRTGRLPQ
jgi:hypothetical protein